MPAHARCSLLVPAAARCSAVGRRQRKLTAAGISLLMILSKMVGASLLAALQGRWMTDPQCILVLQFVRHIGVGGSAGWLQHSSDRPVAH